MKAGASMTAEEFNQRLEALRNEALLDGVPGPFVVGALRRLQVHIEAIWQLNGPSQSWAVEFRERDFKRSKKKKRKKAKK